MFDIGWQEIFLVAVAALIVIGPKDLPRTLKTVMGAVRKVKGMARDFQGGLDDIVRETELADMRKEIEDQTGGDIRKTIENTIDPDGDISRDLDEMRGVEGDLTSAAKGFSDDINKVEEDAKSGLPDENEAMTFSPPETKSEPDPVPEPEKVTASADTTANDKDKKDG